jgi:hypothetical protein
MGRTGDRPSEVVVIELLGAFNDALIIFVV